MPRPGSRRVGDAADLSAQDSASSFLSDAARRRKRRRWLTLPVLLVALPLTAAWLLLESHPLVEGDALTPEGARHARELVFRVRHAFAGPVQPREFTLREEELNGLTALGERAVPRLRGRVDVTDGALLAALSWQIPPNSSGPFLNASARLLPSTRGLEVDRMRVGSVPVPWALAKPVVRLALGLALGWDNGRVALDMVEGVELSGDRVVVRFRPVADYPERLVSVRRHLQAVRDEAAVVGDPVLVRAYLDEIVAIAEGRTPGVVEPLSTYLRPVFASARRRSASGSAVDENRAALMALAIYFGTSRFELLTGPVRSPEAQRHFSRAWSTTLAGRRDLRLHFVYSAALKLAADSGVSFALGEFKELLDAGRGGSGFSFADLAANRAGIRFAEKATSSEAAARRLQELLAGDSAESAFFPPLGDLPEGLAQARFEAEYRDLEAPAYRGLIAEIDRRIDGLPLYR